MKRLVEEAVADDAELRRILEAVERREVDPLTAVDEIVEKVFQTGPFVSGRLTAFLPDESSDDR
jgi:hypothetical protein